MANSTMDWQQIAEEKRKRGLATLKASNQMLEEAKKTALEHTSDPIKRAELEAQFDKAFEDNKNMAERILNATMDEVENATFRDADPIEVEKYKRRLEKRGISDEEMHRKEIATVTIGKDGETKIPRRRRRGSRKEDLDIERIENEEEIMRQTLVTDDKQIQENVEKNEKIEQQIVKESHNIVKNFEKGLAKELENKKINIVDKENVEVKTKTENTSNIVDIEEIKEESSQKIPNKTKRKEEVVLYDFDFSSIPSYVQYDVLPLPSNGQCYPKSSPLRCGRIPVAYLTAADENIIFSPNVYRDGKLIDILLSRKVLDKRININDLCSGDRDAIVLWLRATSYGDDFPITVTNPNNNKRYNLTIKLSQFDYYDFNLESDENGLFDFNTSNGDLIKFKFLTNNDEEQIRKTLTSQMTDSNRLEIIQNINNVSKLINNLDVSTEEVEMLKEDIDEIKDIVGVDIDSIDNEQILNTITEQMIRFTVSVNGNDDRDFIKNYIENMRTKIASDYRNFYNKNKPGVNFEFTVNVPESDGGGSFSTFLRFNDTIFINV